MADLSTGGSGGGDAYTYVQNAQPSGAEEGESWYDTGANAAFVFDGAAWIEQTVAAHGDLSGVGSSDHHSRPSGTGSQSAQAEYYESALKITSGITGTTATTESWTATYPNPVMSTETEFTYNTSDLNELQYYELRDPSGNVIASKNINSTGGTFTITHAEQLVAELYVEGNIGDTDNVNVELKPKISIGPKHAHNV